MSPKSGRIYERFMKEAATDRLVMAPDYPGFGDSDPPPETPNVTIEDYAYSMWRAVDNMGLESGQIDLLGYHTGSFVGAEMARQRPDSVTNIVMISAPVFTPEELAAKNKAYTPIALDEAGTRFQKMWDAVMFYRPNYVPLEIAAQSFSENLKAGERYFWGHRAAFDYAPKFTQVVSGLSQKIVVMNPKDDLFVETTRIAPFLKNGNVIDYPDWGHGFLDVFSREAAKTIKASLE